MRLQFGNGNGADLLLGHGRLAPQEQAVIQTMDTLPQRTACIIIDDHHHRQGWEFSVSYFLRRTGHNLFFRIG